MADICMVFEMVQMMWIGPWIHHHPTSVACGSLYFGKSAEILGIWQTESMSMPSWGGWGFRPTQSGCHIHVRHIQDVCLYSNDVDRHVDPSSLCYRQICWCGFWKISWNAGYLQDRLHTVMRWLRLSINTKWLSHPYQTGVCHHSNDVDRQMDPSSVTTTVAAVPTTSV